MQPAIRAGRALLPLQKLLADNGERDVTAMRGSAVLQQKNSLPGAELHLAASTSHWAVRRASTLLWAITTSTSATLALPRSPDAIRIGASQTNTFIAGI